MSQEFIKLTQGPAALADEVALNKDEQGFTHPNLHRRVKSDATTADGLPRKYGFSIQGVDSYRNAETVAHDEESTTTEVP